MGLNKKKIYKNKSFNTLLKNYIKEIKKKQ